MKIKKSICFLLFLFVIDLFNLNSRTSNQVNSLLNEQFYDVADFPEMELKDVSVLLYANSIDYFLCKSSAVGFQFDLLKNMSKDMNISLDISISTDIEEISNACFTNKYDIIAFDHKENALLDHYLILSEPLSISKPVIIGEKNFSNSFSQKDTILISSVFNQKNLINAISSDVAGTFIVDNSSLENLFSKVNNNANNFLICNYHEAISLLTFFNKLKIIKFIDYNYERRWTLNPLNIALNEKINKWITTFKGSSKYKYLCKKYISHTSTIYAFAFGKNQQISQYDSFIKKVTHNSILDWKFVSSIIYQETKFYTDLTGNGGSFGIMQLMPATAEQFNVSDSSSTEEQILAGIKYLKFLNNQYSYIENLEERLKFIAGAYNIGPGHINDAIRLCEKHGENPNKWTSVAHYLSLKNNVDYYNDIVVKHGRCSGPQTVKYVSQVFDRYEKYNAMIN